MKQEQVFINAYKIKLRKWPKSKISNKTIIQLTWYWITRHQKKLQKIFLDMRQVGTKVFFSKS